VLNLLGKLLGQRSYEVLDKIVHGGKQLWSAFNADADDDDKCQRKPKAKSHDRRVAESRPRIVCGQFEQSVNAVLYS